MTDKGWLHQNINKINVAFTKHKHLRFLVPACLVVLVLIIFLASYFGCKSRPTVYITQDTIEEKQEYKVAKDTTIYYGSGETLQFGHDLLNLKALSQDHKGITNFTFKGAVDFGFLVDFDMDCRLYGTKDALMEWSGEGSNNGCGIVVGNTETPDGVVAYDGDLYIDKSAKFNISSVSGSVFGVTNFCSTTAKSKLTINGTFELSSTSGGAYGVYLEDCVIGGSLTVNGTFNISSGTWWCFGVWILTAGAGSNETINGDFKIECISSTAWGVYFVGVEANSKQVIDGSFEISANDGGGILLYDFAGSATADGAFTIHQTNALSATMEGVHCAAYSPSGSLVVNGIFTIDGCNIIGVTIDATGNENDSGGWTVTINALFRLYGIYEGSVQGVHFSSITNGSLTINGAFMLNSSFVCSLYGLVIENPFIGSITANGTFAISCLSDGVESAMIWISCIQIDASDFSGSLVVNGIFSVYCHPLSVECSQVINVLSMYSGLNTGSSLTINGIFALFADETDILLQNTDGINNLNMNNAQFFSNQIDSGDVFQQGYTGSYKWNGSDASGVGSPVSSNSSEGDASLQLKTINDNDNDPNFAIRVIDTDGKGGASKSLFNSAYKNSLKSYVNQKYCSKIVKPWLKAIINKI